MEYSFFLKYHFLFSANCMRLTGAPMGTAGLEKSQWRNAGPLPKLCTRESEWSPSHHFSRISAGSKSENDLWYQFSCQRHLAVPSSRLLLLAWTHVFFGRGGGVWEGPSWSVLMDFSGLLSRLIRVEHSWENWKASWNMAMSDCRVIPQQSVEIQGLNAKRLQWAHASHAFQAIHSF